MGKRGPKKTPTNILKLRGSRRADDRPKNEPQPERGMPKPPKDLDGLALEHWFSIAPMLHEQGTLTLIDATALAAFCDAFANYQQLKIECRVGRSKLVLMLKAKSGNMYPNPLFGMMKSARAEMCRLAAEFGMTPSGRTGINVPDKVERRTSAQKWLAKQKNA